ncbi:carboxylesterase/lipase family protein [Sphingomonas sp. AP4-R1]|uniref:carboxylesterase/lipase family protein n=1 Tax=Sphingomonas sp. AP4-R1 TaxID=2735134 RepID=UPI0020A3A363|nr:carboxylesterase family protein [Sphingomonas sp. AP4-R1]
MGFCVAATDAPQVRIETGVLSGATVDGVNMFKGIPFAAPPVASLRWRAPEPPASWTGVRAATGYGNDCMQIPVPSDAAPLGMPPAEDCLYANVWRPAGSDGKLPVMIWIYGGGFVNGGASPPTYSGAELAKQGIVVVSFNYRIGRFGFFAHPALTRENDDDGLLANYGYMDQLAALKWVKRNIASFGGDPANVTIVGESAGGMSIHALATSPIAQGLFQRMVILSGPSGRPADATLNAAETAGATFAEANGIARDAPDAVSRLRALPADRVMNGLNMSTMSAPGPRPFLGPVIDGRLAVDNLKAYREGHFRHIPAMIGATSDDMGGPKGRMVTGTREAVTTLAGQGVPVYYYRFSYVAGSARTPETKGARHATDIPFFFDTAAVKYGGETTATDRAAAKVASRYMVNFVRTGDPNGSGLPIWQPYSRDRKHMLDLNAEGSATLLVEDDDS